MTTLTLKQDALEPTRPVTVAGVAFGATDVPVIAGPCAVEDEAQLVSVAHALRDLGIPLLRAGLFKPRTSPYAFQGLGDTALPLVAQVKKEFNLAIISEILSAAQVELAGEVIDCFQVGARNMQNFELLKELGKQPRPVLLKRGLAATLEEFLNAAEYIAMGGNTNIILCERGIRGFDPQTRNVLDLAGAVLLKQKTHLPVIIDPSHATGQRSLVAPCAKAAIAAGLDGLMIEAHPSPVRSISDADQAISLEDLRQLVDELQPLASAVGRQLHNQRAAVGS